jgi:DNA-binding NtrC family response regulator
MKSTDAIREGQPSSQKHLRVALASSEFRSEEVLINLLRQRDLEPVVASSLEESKALLRREEVALLICHASSSEGDFRELLKVAGESESSVPVVICTDFYDPRLYLEAMELGAFDYFSYPYYRDGVDWVVGKAVDQALRNKGISPEPQRVTYRRVTC